MEGMTYKGYAARVEFDAKDRIFVGNIIGLRDIVGFHGETVNELERKHSLFLTVRRPAKITVAF